MVLKEKEKQAIKDLQTLEQACIDKYGKYAAQAKDPVLQELFTTLKRNEQKHYDSLEQVLTGTVPSCNCNDSDGRDYDPKATASSGSLRTRKTMPFLQRTVSPVKSSHPLNITVMYSSLATVQSASFLPTSRLKNRIMPRCSSNTKQQTGWHKTSNKILL